MRRAPAFAGLAALQAAAAGLLFICGCGTGVPAPSDAAGSGGASGGTSGADAGSGGVVGSGGAVGTGGAIGSGGLAGSGGTPGSGGASSGGAAGAGGGETALSLTSPAFDDVEGCSSDDIDPCDVFPDENVSYMERPNISPELHWTDAPSGTQSFALVLFDVTYGQAHWTLWNIPADAAMLAADVAQDTKMPAVPVGSEQANANFADTSTDGYFGPHMPCNVFEFQLFALALPTFTPASPDSAVLVHAELQNLGDAVLGLATLRGRAADYDVTCE